jgi:hypothetical protein
MARIVDARCIVEIEQSFDSLHAYSVPDGVEVGPGDVAFIHQPPTSVPFGERLVQDCAMTVHKAGFVRRAWVRMTSVFALTQLYEVGFEAENVT